MTVWPVPVIFPPMDFEHPPAEPVALCEQWFLAAAKLPLPNPNAMTLATLDPDGHPSARIVLLRGFDHRGAVFYTNRESRKGLALHHLPRAALLFHWDEAPLGRQLRIEGAVTPTLDTESDAYWHSRSRASQINGWASAQSRPVANRAALLAAQGALEQRYAGGPVPRPPHWGGYRVALGVIEFWQGDRDRLHDRLLYTHTAAGWQVQRLSP